ncbi:hypothetical protein EON65_14050 [archaeon]|nr:MAG: hypothetical protein EON65_14050 [archaeon]
MDGGSVNQLAKILSSSQVRKTTTIPVPTTLPSDWQQHRDVNPVQRKVTLDFNYWMEARRLDIKGIHDVISSLVTGQKAACLGQALDNVENVVIVTVSEVNHEHLAAHMSSCSFLSSCSSVPTLLVERADLPNLSAQNNTSPLYDWYYNDVKELNALLLWPYVPRIMAKDDVKLADAIDSHLVTFKVLNVCDVYVLYLYL